MTEYILASQRVLRKERLILSAAVSPVCRLRRSMSVMRRCPARTSVYDQLPVFGGSMDAAGSAANGYVSRGERELEPYMECLWDLFGSIPSLYEEGRTVQDETRECNKNWEIDSKHRLWEQGFVPHDESTMGVTPETQEQMIKMMLTEEDQLEDVTIKQWFSPAFFQSQLWYYWSSMLAFQPTTA